MPHGFTEAEWDAEKAEALNLMIERAKDRGMIPYSDLVTKIKTIHVDAHDQRLFHLLGEVSAEEDAAGRGMLSVVVVHKTGDMQPGPGFFELAKQRGRNTSDILKCLFYELKRVHTV